MAWVTQKKRDIEAKGAKAAPWVCEWYDVDGNRRSKTFAAGFKGKKAAERYAVKIEDQLLSGETQTTNTRKTWSELRAEYEEAAIPGVSTKTAGLIRTALNHFERLCTPKRIAGINNAMLTKYVNARRKEPGKKPGSTISPSSINHELGYIKAVLHKAVDFGYLQTAPKFPKVREPKKLKHYVTPDHFEAIYEACDQIDTPMAKGVESAGWWRGLLTFQFLTGWRISEVLALRKEDVDLKTGQCLTRHGDNKATRDEFVTLPAVVMAHVEPLLSDRELVFPWYHSRRCLTQWFEKIQKAAKITLVCREEHDHTPSCPYYGFHDLRRGFASLNAGRLPSDVLQRLMRHKDFKTTKRYIQFAEDVNANAPDVFVPDIFKKKE